MRALTAALLVLLLALCRRPKQPDVVAAIEKLADAPSKMVLYSLNPSNVPGSKDTYNERMFDGFPILDRAEISDRNEQRALLRALARGASENDNQVGLCFNPRHALHVEQSGHAIDFTICFECFQVAKRGFSPGAFLTSRSPEPIFDESLKAHDMPVSPQ